MQNNQSLSTTATSDDVSTAAAINQTKPAKTQRFFTKNTSSVFTQSFMDACLDDIVEIDNDEDDALNLCTIGPESAPNAFQEQVDEWERACDELKPAKIIHNGSSKSDESIFDINWPDCFIPLPNLEKESEDAFDSLKFIVQSFSM